MSNDKCFYKIFSNVQKVKEIITKAYSCAVFIRVVYFSRRHLRMIRNELKIEDCEKVLEELGPYVKEHKNFHTLKKTIAKEIFAFVQSLPVESIDQLFNAPCCDLMHKTLIKPVGWTGAMVASIALATWAGSIYFLGITSLIGFFYGVSIPPLLLSTLSGLARVRLNAAITGKKQLMYGHIQTALFTMGDPEIDHVIALFLDAVRQKSIKNNNSPDEYPYLTWAMPPVLSEKKENYDLDANDEVPQKRLKLKLMVFLLRSNNKP